MDNMITPPSVPLDRLAGILANAKKVMKASDSIASPSQSSRMSDKALAPRIDEDVEYIQNIPQEAESKYLQPIDINPNMVKNSRLPDSVKKLMINNPIDKVGMNHTFKAEDVASLMEEYEEKENPYIPPIKKRPVATQPQQLRENKQANYGVSEDRIREILKEEVHNYMTNVYNKTLTEKVVKQTIGTLLKEGVIKKNLK